VSARHDDADDAAGAAGIRITSGSPSPVEVAAATAVVAAALEQLAEEADRRRDEGGANAWERSRRGVRRALNHGDWRHPSR
jgi:hypothetical protein